MIDTKKHPLHRFAPNVIEGQFKQDSAEHYEWEDSEHRRLLSMEGYSWLRKWLNRSVWIVAVCAVLGALSYRLGIDVLSLVDFTHLYLRPQ